MIARPIFVASLPRSGSSLVAGLLAKHGVWVGTCREADEHNPKGYFESVGMSKLVGKEVGHGVNRGRTPTPPADWRQKVEAMILADGYAGGPWLWKASALYWRLMEPFDPHWVIVRRPLDAVRASGRASGIFGAGRASVQAHMKALADIEARGAAEIDADALVDGDCSGLAAALGLVGLGLNRALVESFVDPTLWHYGGVGV